MKWKKIEAGKYESEDGRFTAKSEWDRESGNHWVLYDKNAPAYEKQGILRGDTLKECKDYAEQETKPKSSIPPAAFNPFSDYFLGAAKNSGVPAGTDAE